jgi:uncharacterized protein (DUF885 family)
MKSKRAIPAQVQPVVMRFNDPVLIKKYGSWVRVQVAFYDFIFQEALKLCPNHFREKAYEEAMTGGFADGEDFYERSIKAIKKHFKTPDEAWQLFISA